MQGYWIGMDAGGSGTTIEILDAQYSRLKKIDQQPLQASLQSPDETASACVEILLPILRSQKMQPRGIGIAMAGAGSKSLQQHIQDNIQQEFLTVPVLVTSDAPAAHVGAYDGGYGLLIIAGTGSLLLHRSEEGWHKAGGYGPEIGDDASGRKIGLRGLKIASEAFDGGPSTMLTTFLESEFSINRQQDLIDWVYHKKNSPAAVAPGVIRSAQQGDQQCVSILREEIHLLIQKITWLLDGKSSDLTYTLHGGLFNNEFFEHQFVEILHKTYPDASRINPQYSASAGVVQMLRDQ